MILLLSTNTNKIIDFLNEEKIPYLLTEDKIDEELIKINNINFIISYRYKHIIKKNIIDLNIPIVNLHISYLPWNKGADPNLWSFLQNTKKGITIHYINEGVDTGDIIYQEEYTFSDCETLTSSYDFLNNEIQDLFIKHFYDIINNNCPRIKQIDKGSLHKLKDKEKIIKIINENGGWNITIKKLKELKF